MSWTKTLIIIIIILSIILGLKIAGVDLSKKDGIMSQTEIIALMRKSGLSDNIYYKNDKEVERFEKNDIVLMKSNNIHLWVNEETGEELLVDIEKKQVFENVDVATFNSNDNSTIFIEVFGTLIERGIFSLEDKGRKTIGDRETIIVEMRLGENLTKEELEEFIAEWEKNSTGWRLDAFIEYKDTSTISEEKFALAKESSISQFAVDKETGIIIDESWKEFSIGTVTDEDIRKPDITGYEHVSI